MTFRDDERARYNVLKPGLLPLAVERRRLHADGQDPARRNLCPALDRLSQ